MGVDLMPFADNWAYLRTELAWLDRLLMLAVARARKDEKIVKKVAATPADKVSSHWWKGVISVPNPAYDDCRVVPTKAKCKPSVGYQNQLESRIKISAKDSVVLGLPSLRNYLNLTLFEKNLLLMALAPEVDRRYGRLYHFLQTGEEKGRQSDLVMVDLALRLLCRNDLERRRARARLTRPDSLIAKRVLHYVSSGPSTRLSSHLQISDEWVNYLLAEQPDQAILFQKLATREPVLALPEPTSVTRALHIRQPAVSWDQLILPTPAMAQLQTLSQQASASLVTANQSSQVALMVGAAGTGKTMAARAIATSIRQPLCEVDLSDVNPEDWPQLLTMLEPTRYPVLLIKSASLWFGRKRTEKTTVSKADIQQWIQRRQAASGVTMLSVRYLHTMSAHWRQRMDVIVTLPVPHKTARKMMWRQAFAGITCSSKIDWVSVAAQLKVTGGEVDAIAQQAVVIAQSKNAKSISLSHIQQAAKQRGLSVVFTGRT